MINSKLQTYEYNNKIKEIYTKLEYYNLTGSIKDRMADFIDRKYDVMLCTTIIETGIDINNVNTLIIYNADRFGLSQLYQIRGRVGRSNLQSYCYLVTNTKNNERLKVMEESSDGFYISEMDFKQRGQGDLFGIKQSGDMSFKIANLNRDYNILMQTNKDSNEFLTSNNYKENELYTNIVKDIANLD